MAWIATAIVGSAIVGALSSRSAARTQASAANNATNAQTGMFNQTRDDQAPWRAAGATSLDEIMRGFGLGDPNAPGGAGSGYFNHQFDNNDLNANLAPNYEFMRQQGAGGVASMANAMGGLGGNSLTAISKWNNDYAQNAYQQAFQNYNSQRTDIYNRLASIAGLGQTAGSNSATGGSAYSGNIANSMMGAGNAMAAGTMGVANALSGGVNSGMGYYYMNRLLPPGGSPSGDGLPG